MGRGLNLKALISFSKWSKGWYENGRGRRREENAWKREAAGLSGIKLLGGKYK